MSFEVSQGLLAIILVVTAYQNPTDTKRGRFFACFLVWYGLVLFGAGIAGHIYEWSIVFGSFIIAAMIYYLTSSK